MGPRGLEDYGSEGLQLIKEKLTLHYPPSTTRSEGLQLIKEKLTLHYPPSTTPYRTM